CTPVSANVAGSTRAQSRPSLEVQTAASYDPSSVVYPTATRRPPALCTDQICWSPEATRSASSTIVQFRPSVDLHTAASCVRRGPVAPAATSVEPNAAKSRTVPAFATRSDELECVSLTPPLVDHQIAGTWSSQPPTTRTSPSASSLENSVTATAR